MKVYSSRMCIQRKISLPCIWTVFVVHLSKNQRIACHFVVSCIPGIFWYWGTQSTNVTLNDIFQKRKKKLNILVISLRYHIIPPNGIWFKIFAIKMPAALEFLPPQKRAIAAFLSFMAWTAGMCATAVLAWAVRGWRYIIIAGLVADIYMLALWWWVEVLLSLQITSLQNNWKNLNIIFQLTFTHKQSR